MSLINTTTTVPPASQTWVQYTSTNAALGRREDKLRLHVKRIGIAANDNLSFRVCYNGYEEDPCSTVVGIDLSRPNAVPTWSLALEAANDVDIPPGDIFINLLSHFSNQDLYFSSDTVQAPVSKIRFNGLTGQRTGMSESSFLAKERVRSLVYVDSLIFATDVPSWLPSWQSACFTSVRIVVLTNRGMRLLEEDAVLGCGDRYTQITDRSDLRTVTRYQKTDSTASGYRDVLVANNQYTLYRYELEQTLLKSAGSSVVDWTETELYSTPTVPSGRTRSEIIGVEHIDGQNLLAVNIYNEAVANFPASPEAVDPITYPHGIYLISPNDGSFVRAGADPSDPPVVIAEPGLDVWMWGKFGTAYTDFNGDSKYADYLLLIRNSRTSGGKEEYISLRRETPPVAGSFTPQPILYIGDGPEVVPLQPPVSQVSTDPATGAAIFNCDPSLDPLWRFVIPAKQATVQRELPVPYTRGLRRNAVVALMPLQKEYHGAVWADPADSSPDAPPISGVIVVADVPPSSVGQPWHANNLAADSFRRWLGTSDENALKRWWFASQVQYDPSFGVSPPLQGIRDMDASPQGHIAAVAWQNYVEYVQILGEAVSWTKDPFEIRGTGIRALSFSHFVEPFPALRSKISENLGDVRDPEPQPFTSGDLGHFDVWNGGSLTLRRSFGVSESVLWTPIDTSVTPVTQTIRHLHGPEVAGNEFRLLHWCSIRASLDAANPGPVQIDLSLNTPRYVTTSVPSGPSLVLPASSYGVAPGRTDRDIEFVYGSILSLSMTQTQLSSPVETEVTVSGSASAVEVNPGVVAFRVSDKIRDVDYFDMTSAATPPAGYIPLNTNGDTVAPVQFSQDWAIAVAFQCNISPAGGTDPHYSATVEIYDVDAPSRVLD
ncbi:MAG: hypothetical protein D6800_09000, partial [Candidatus Zixiibacteriota bacterium]